MQVTYIEHIECEKCQCCLWVTYGFLGHWFCSHFYSIIHTHQTCLSDEMHTHIYNLALNLKHSRRLEHIYSKRQHGIMLSHFPRINNINFHFSKGQKNNSSFIFSHWTIFLDSAEIESIKIFWYSLLPLKLNNFERM